MLVAIRNVGPWSRALNTLRDPIKVGGVGEKGKAGEGKAMEGTVGPKERGEISLCVCREGSL